MKLKLALLMFVIGLIVVGCGGGGGSSSSATSSTSTSSTGSTQTIKLVAVNSSGAFVDPNNLQVGDTATFKLVSFNLSAQTFTTLNANGFATTDTTSASGTLNTSSGTFTARTATGVAYTVSTTYSGSTYSTPLQVFNVENRISGVIHDQNGLPVPFARVVFVDATATTVASTVANYDGTFNGSIPGSASRFNLDATSLNSNSYYKLFYYGTGSYGPLITTCSAPLPSLIPGTNGLPYGVIVADVYSSSGAQNTPPAPPACSP